MKELKNLCELGAVSGREDAVREYIIEKIKDNSEIKIDPLGNIIAFVKGRKAADKIVMVDAHMDEVGLIITSITDNGMLKFTTVGGIDISVLLSRRVIINGMVGVICQKPVHLLSNDEKEKMPTIDSLCIDIGASDRSTAEKKVNVGDVAFFDSSFENLGELIISKALDDRIGCWALIDIINSKPQYDFYATFTVGEEVGLIGAKTAAYTVNPDYAVVIEATTAADIAGVEADKKVCFVDKGAVLSFMDRATLYDKTLFEKAKKIAIEENIKYQVKFVVAGGNNAGAIHQSRGGVKTVAVSVPCRYIHSPSCVASFNDIKAVRDLCVKLIEKMASGEIE